MVKRARDGEEERLEVEREVDDWRGRSGGGVDWRWRPGEEVI
jgi:hypothetical protein